MSECWEKEASNRPTFEFISSTIARLQQCHKVRSFGFKWVFCAVLSHSTRPMIGQFHRMILLDSRNSSVLHFIQNTYKIMRLHETLGLPEMTVWSAGTAYDVCEQDLRKPDCMESIGDGRSRDVHWTSQQIGKMQRKMTFSWSLVEREHAMNLSSCRVLSSIAVRNLWLLPVSWYYLTNTVHVAVRLFSNRSQMTSICGENKKVTHEPLGVTDVLTPF